MKEKRFFKDNKDEFEYLFRIQKKPFVLFLGAGINCYYPEMSWNSLLEALMKSVVTVLSVAENLSKKEKQEVLDFLMDKKNAGNSDNISKFDTYYKASLIKKVLGNQYIPFIQNHLYSHCNRAVIKKNIQKQGNLLTETAKLIQNFSNIKAAVTYNYDNFLNETLKLLLPKGDNRKFVDIYKEVQEDTHDADTFPIYHVHGFIPPSNQPLIVPNENIVLAYDEYFCNIMEPYSWQTTTQLHFLNNYNVLFLGASLSDWNMLRALSNSARYSNATNRYVLFVNEYHGLGSRKSLFLRRLKASVYDEFGIKPIFTPTNDFKEIPKFLEELNKTIN